MIDELSSLGFGEYADDGTRRDFTPNTEFETSQDQDAQQKWQRILGCIRGIYSKKKRAE